VSPGVEKFLLKKMKIKVKPQRKTKRGKYNCHKCNKVMETPEVEGEHRSLDGIVRYYECKECLYNSIE
jgi:hypothetical protein